ncbi:hypothetical protein JOB18_049583 [Solea senegalensis]|uniref:Uncharacterized protein n=2 Tax=Solea senegalensis TaxID=28829 RepID=A0AAV6R7J6_SOLSE|nr:UPF0500 protein C1orf216 homolog isoform X1 [Solea senegalensis]KAG7501431.1 hypothetical protein JOB18_049583 [Solea senegalensis]
MGDAQSRSVMLHHQDQPRNYGGQGGTNNTSSSSLRNRKCDKDGNFNFLPGKDEEDFTGSGGGDENRNQVRPRSLGPLGRDPPNSSPSSAYHNSSGTQRPRMPCWSPLEPLPEIESVDDGFGRVPPDGAEEGRMEEEEEVMMRRLSEMKRREKKQPQMKKGGMVSRGKEEEVDILKLEDDDEWGDSDSGSEDSYQSGSSMSSLHLESTGDRVLMGGWDRVGVGEPKLSPQDGDQCTNTSREWVSRQSFSQKSLAGSFLGDLTEEGRGPGDDDDQSSDTDGEKSELMDAVWTLRDRERFKAQEMEKHQVQLTMYRRLALIRWVRTLQSHVQEQQNRLQSSFDVILTHRKELLRMGAAAAAMANAAPPTAVGQ